MSSKELQELRKRVLKQQLLLSQVARNYASMSCLAPKLMEQIKAEAEFVIVEKKNENRS